MSEESKELQTESATTEVSTDRAQERLAALAAHIKKNVKITGTGISPTLTGKLKFPSGDEVDYLDVVVLDYRYRNQYFASAYNPNNMQPCECFAIGYEENDLLVPSELSPEVQAVACAECDKNQWGSSPSGKGKACSNQLMLAVMLPDTAESADIMVVKASPTSLKSVKTHLLRSTELFGHPINCITRLTVDTSRGWATIKAEIIGRNNAPEQHVQYLDTAGQVLEAPPVSPSQATAKDPTHNLKGSGREARA